MKECRVPLKGDKVVLIDNKYVEKHCTSKKEYREMVNFYRANAGSPHVPHLWGADDPEMRTLTAYMPGYTTLEALRKQHKLPQEDRVGLRKALITALGSIDGDYQDFSNLNNIAAKQLAPGLWKVIFFEGGRRLGAPDALVRYDKIVGVAPKFKPKT